MCVSSFGSIAMGRLVGCVAVGFYPKPSASGGQGLIGRVDEEAIAISIDVIGRMSCARERENWVSGVLAAAAMQGDYLMCGKADIVIAEAMCVIEAANFIDRGILKGNDYGALPFRARASDVLASAAHGFHLLGKVNCECVPEGVVG